MEQNHEELEQNELVYIKGLERPSSSVFESKLLGLDRIFMFSL